MGTPTVTAIGAANGLLLITDKDGKVHRVPKNSICDIRDSSNDHSSRLDVCHAGGEITLLFASPEEITTALSAIDALY